ncbi:nitrite reductase small subunit NirD [Piscinibacter sp. HJYY11]|uniref:nitrite reductase small subunit NirD n=1 Tax=Piscinibacter sp. HJYY11 TaxID=2801333 RepID=UPI00191EF170|nr:nitrite reductase small subunit NirD [Piscinibacter sp. HJYY11]MBL0727021.1 nitrite reductase small subunit NirD [Piscinibacter sp. HJYY11]
MSHWTLICTVDDLPPLGSRRVTRPNGAPVAVFRAHDDRIFAILDRCPHKGGPLSQGIVFGTNVACPLHNMSIGLDDGRVKEPDEGCVPTFAVRVDAGSIYLDADELATLGIDLPLPVAGPCATRRL